MRNSAFNHLFRARKEIEVVFDESLRALWLYFTPSGRECFNLTLLREMHEVQKEVMAYFGENPVSADMPIRFFIAASRSQGIYNLGGDLALFSQLIEERDEEGLRTYAEACIKCVYFHAVGLHLPITTLSVVQGTALGGGLEAALAANVCIAEKGTQLGFPEVKFNLFPGMGAYTLVSRKLGVPLADQMLMEGKLHSAEEMHALGLVQRLAEVGEGKQVADEYMRKTLRAINGLQAIRDAGLRSKPIEYEELNDITNLWVAAALRIEKKDLRLMRRLVSGQDRKVVEKNRKAS